MFYVYQDGICGTELIGKSETYEGAKQIKDERDAQWRPGYLWTTRISDKEEKETCIFD